MDQNEMIALGIVLVAVLLAIRYFLKRKGGGCCSDGCFKPKGNSEKK